MSLEKNICDRVSKLLAASGGHVFQDRDVWEKIARALELENSALHDAGEQFPLRIKSYQVHFDANGIIGDDMCFIKACDLARKKRKIHPNNTIEVHAIIDA